MLNVRGLPIVSDEHVSLVGCELYFRVADPGAAARSTASIASIAETRLEAVLWSLLNTREFVLQL